MRTSRTPLAGVTFWTLIGLQRHNNSKEHTALMVTVEILRRATAHAGIKAVLNRLAKDALINRQIDLTTDTGNVPGQPNLLRLNFLPENRQNVHVNTNPASHEQFDFGSHDQPDPVS